eukprot:172335-Pyramimonas_sp.AAC.1
MLSVPHNSPLAKHSGLELRGTLRISVLETDATQTLVDNAGSFAPSLEPAGAAAPSEPLDEPADKKRKLEEPGEAVNEAPESIKSSPPAEDSPDDRATGPAAIPLPDLPPTQVRRDFECADSFIDVPDTLPPPDEWTDAQPRFF